LDVGTNPFGCSLHLGLSVDVGNSRSVAQIFRVKILEVFEHVLEFIRKWVWCFFSSFPLLDGGSLMYTFRFKWNLAGLLLLCAFDGCALFDRSLFSHLD
jgi:hypothetical protein